jgi:hypothetical protein
MSRPRLPFSDLLASVERRKTPRKDSKPRVYRDMVEPTFPRCEELLRTFTPEELRDAPTMVQDAR